MKYFTSARTSDPPRITDINSIYLFTRFNTVTHSTCGGGKRMRKWLNGKGLKGMGRSLAGAFGWVPKDRKTEFSKHTKRFRIFESQTKALL